MEAKITAQSQTHRLRERAGEARIRHGQEVRADIPNVRVGAAVGSYGWYNEPLPEPGSGEGEAQVFFCNIGPIHVREVRAEGDSEALPGSVTLAGLDVPRSGRYDLINVLVRSNGSLQVILDEDSRVAPVVEREMATPL